MARRKPIIRYGISLGIDTTDMARGAREANRVTRRLNKDVGQAERANREYRHSLMTLKTAYREGAITKEQYSAAIMKELERRNRLNGVARKQKLQMQQEQEAQRKLNKEKREAERQSKRLEQQLNKETSARAKNAQRMGGGLAGGLSFMGMGGRGAGAARFAGNFGAMSGMGIGEVGALGLGAAGLMGTGAFIKKSIDDYAALESKLVDLKVLFGESKGSSLAEQFKSLAKNTALTTTQLVTNAKTWASYGLTSDNITERLKRLGTVAGGNTEKFNALTVAFAQVNAQGKLMGQEKNQLINAGFSLSEVAKVAGVEMRDFAKAMEEGAITAEHVNQALVNMTEEGGLFAGLLEEKAKTLEGRATIVASKWEEARQVVGEASKGWADLWYEASGALADYVKAHSEFVASTRDDSIGTRHTATGKLMEGKGMGGSYSMTGKVLGATLGGNIDVQEGVKLGFWSSLFSGAGTTSLAKKGRQYDYKAGAAKNRLSREVLYGADASAYPVFPTSVNAPVKTQAEVDKEEEEKKRKAEQEAYMQKFKEGYMFLDPESGGYDEYAQKRDEYFLKKDFEEGKMDKAQYKRALDMMLADYERRRQVDKKKDQAEIDKNKAQEEAAKNAKIDTLMGEVAGDQSKYAGKGYSRSAIALLEARDKKLEQLKEADSRRTGTSGGVAGGGAEYALMATRRRERESLTEERQHRLIMEAETKKINARAKNQLMQLKRTNNLLDTKLGGAV